MLYTCMNYGVVMGGFSCNVHFYKTLTWELVNRCRTCRMCRLECWRFLAMDYTRLYWLTNYTVRLKDGLYISQYYCNVTITALWNVWITTHNGPATYAKKRLIPRPSHNNTYRIITPKIKWNWTYCTLRIMEEDCMQIRLFSRKTGVKNMERVT
jgi:hypothetical protein